MAWSVISKTGETLEASNKTYSTLTVAKDKLYRYQVSFEYEGIAKFYSEGDYAVGGYLTTTKTYNSTDGIPRNDLSTGSYIFDDNNFSFYYSVVPNKTYYVWIRSYENKKSGSTTLHIDYVPTTGEKVEVVDTSTPYSVGFELSDDIIYKYEVSFATTGFVLFKTEGSLITDGYLTDTLSCKPLAYDYGNDNGEDQNCCFRYHVVANEPYYVWVKTGSVGQNYTEVETATTLNMSYIPTIVKTLNNLTDDYSEELEISGDKIYQYEITFNQPGCVTCLTKGVVGIDGYLGEDIYHGDYKNWHDNTTGNVCFSELVDTDISYYLWIMSGTLWENGTTILNIIPPGDTKIIDVPLGNIEKRRSIQDVFSEGVWKRYEMTFANSGYANFYTTTNRIGTCTISGYLTLASGDICPPEEYLKYDSKGVNFSYKVDKDTTYYFWTTDTSGNEKGALYIDPPSSVIVQDLGTIKDDTLLPLELSYLDLAYCFKFKFARSESIKFSTISDLATNGYLTTTDAFDGRKPTGTYLTSDENSSTDNSDFSFYYSVLPTQTYYLWVVNHDSTQVGPVTLSIDCPLYAVEGDSFGQIIDDCSFDIPVSNQRIYYHRVGFKYGGKITINFDADTPSRRIYLTPSNQWADGWITPPDAVASGYNRIEYEAEFGAWYYIGILGYEEESDGIATLHIDAPIHPVEGDSFGRIIYDCSFDIPVSSERTYYHEVIFEHRGRITINFDEDTPSRKIYLSTSNAFEEWNEKPNLSYVVSGGYNRIKYDIEAGDRYYIWIEGNEEESDSIATLYIDAPIHPAEGDSFGVVIDNSSFDIPVSSERIYYHEIILEHSGHITINFDADAPSRRMYLTDNTRFNDEYKQPSSVLCCNNDLLECEIVAGTYYIWVEGNEGESDDVIKLYIDPPRYPIQGDSFGVVEENTEMNVPVSSERTYYHEVIFKHRGNARFSFDSDNLDRTIYLTTATDCVDGIPTDILVSVKGYVDYQVRANKIYYIWADRLESELDNTVTLYIDTPRYPKIGDSLGTLVGGYSFDINMSGECTYYYEVMFKYNGTISINFENEDLIKRIVLTTTTAFDNESPKIKDASDLVGEGTTSLKCEIQDSTTYYIWIEGYKGVSDDTTKLYIDSPPDPILINIGEIENMYVTEYPVLLNIWYRYEMTFKNSGVVNFYTEGSSNTKGYLTLDPTEIYPPDEYLDYDQKSIDFSYKVDKGTTYYFWTTGRAEAFDELASVYIFPPSTLITQDLGTIVDDVSSPLELSYRDVAYCFKVKFKYSGEVEFYTVSELGTYGYLTKTNDFNGQRPTGTYLTSDNDSGNGKYDFGFNYKVAKDTTYYLWVINASKTKTGSAILEINYLRRPQAGDSFGTVTTDAYFAIPVSSTYTYYHKVVFSHNGYVEINLEPKHSAQWIYLTTTTNFVGGYPGNEDETDIVGDDSDPLECLVEAGTYYIWVEGEDDAPDGFTTLHIDPPPYVIDGSGDSSITEEVVRDCEISSDLWNRYKVMFANDGKATFYVDGYDDEEFIADLVLTTSDAFDEKTGEPVSDNILDREENLMTHLVFEGEYYYIWVRSNKEDPPQSVKLHITPPWVRYDITDLEIGDFGIHRTIELEPYTLHRFELRFEKKYDAIFYTEGDIDTVGYLVAAGDIGENVAVKEGEIWEWDVDEEEYETATGDLIGWSAANDDMMFIDENEDDENDADIQYKNFHFRDSVEAYNFSDWENTIYYLYVRAKNGSDTGSVKLRINTKLREINVDLGTLSGGISLYFPELCRTVNSFEFQFDYSGTVAFYTVYGKKCVGYLSDNDNFDYDFETDTLIPEKILKESEWLSSDPDFYFTYDVVEGKTYYLLTTNENGDWDDGTMLRIVPFVDHFKLPYIEENALFDSGVVALFRYETWNDLVNKVSEAHRAVTGYDWNDYYASYHETLMTEEDKVLTAKRYNSLRYQIGYLYGTNIDEVHRGDIVESYRHFDDLIEVLNEWIDAMNEGTFY